MTLRWDPLEKAAETAIEIVSAAKKREINNILKSYVGYYDPFCELIQNAMDAVDTREKELGEDEYVKKIWIKIDLQQNRISVTDNGVGFNKEQFETFLCPNISYKNLGVTRGNKGVGATYLAYGFNYLQLATKTPGFDCIAEFSDGRKWVDDKSGVVTRPIVTEGKAIHKAFEQIDRGSSFTIQFGGENTRPKDLSWVSADLAEQWKTILLVKTPLGHITIGEHPYKQICFDVSVVASDGTSSDVIDQKAEYVFPHNVIQGCKALDEIKNALQKKLDQGIDPGGLPPQYRNLNAIYTYLKTDDCARLLNEDFDKSLVKEYEVEAYGFFCYSTAVLDDFNDRTANLRKGMRIIRGGLQLAANHMPQGDLNIIPLSSNIGYQNQAHIIVHFEDAEPDLGRKGFQPELKRVAENISASLVNRLKKWRPYLKKDTGATEGVTNATNLFNWISEQLKHEEEKPLKLVSNNFFKPINELSISAEPISEQDVIVLFNQLIAGGVIRGLRLISTSQHQQYDGIFRYVIKEPFENHIFDKSTNPMGIQALADYSEMCSRPFVLEYKYSVDGLMREFENGEKNERDINLIVAWDIGKEWKKRYSITSLLDLDNLQNRTFHGQTHVFHDENSGDLRFYGVILSELIEYLHDIDGAQGKQRMRYSN